MAMAGDLGDQAAALVERRQDSYTASPGMHLPSQESDSTPSRHKPVAGGCDEIVWQQAHRRGSSKMNGVLNMLLVFGALCWTGAAVAAPMVQLAEAGNAKTTNTILVCTQGWMSASADPLACLSKLHSGSTSAAKEHS